MDRRPVMVITGTSRGIGRGMAEYFVEKGYYVFGCSRGPSALEREGYQHSQVDVGDENQVRRWIRSVKKEYQRVDALVCNAGLVRPGIPFTLTPSDELNIYLRTQVNGTYYACREVSKVMIPRKYGRIITFSSLAVPLHLEGASAYVAAKGAIVEMTKVFAKELAPSGITCNVLAPSLIMTAPAQAMGQAWADWLLEKLTIRRIVTIEEICNVVSFFVSREGGCITGQVVNMGLVS